MLLLERDMRDLSFLKFGQLLDAPLVFGKQVASESFVFVYSDHSPSNLSVNPFSFDS